jgi:hypothetical protein
MGITVVPNGFWLDVLAGWAADRDTVSGHTAFVLRRPVREAITQLKIVEPPAAVVPHPDESNAHPR